MLAEFVSFPMVRMDFRELYAIFQAPLTTVDCGERCAPYNELGVPFCCDSRQMVPTVYLAEWEFLRANTDLWRLWEGDESRNAKQLQNQTPAGQVLVVCKGHVGCQREFRSLTCRAFPFFPYFNSRREFIGLSYYWEYEDRCWVISNLRRVSREFRSQFISVYEALFAAMPEEVDNFYHHSVVTRRVFGHWKRAILLLHRNGKVYKISPHSDRMRSVNAVNLPKFGPYKVAAKLPFEDEVGRGE